ncbi:gamma-glutamylcyclotransferase family protein [Thermus sediminis]|uniref:gamma-glutamylcyclotransferase family protein n=1 Tax=Thermus sediminis TaxID=1761908 RepID=UPI000E3D18A0|nr:gamma-glutamylcyclotransferase [Thermus sediminis]
MERVFAYGTLKRGERNHFLVVPYLHRVLPGRVWGFRLFHLPQGEKRPYPYPAMVPGEGWVDGEVLFLDLEALPLLDELEEEGVEYRRVQVQAETPEGLIPAWAYLYLGDLEGARPLPPGAWEG